MKNMRKKLLFGILPVAIITLAIINSKFIIPVNGNPLEENPFDNTSKEQCDLSDARDRYVPKVTVSNDPNVNYFTVGITRGVFDVYIYEIMSNDYGQTWPELRGSFVLGNFGGNKTNQVNFTRESIPKHYEVVFVLKEADELCGVEPNTQPIRNNENGTWGINTSMGFVYTHQVEIAASAANGKVANVHYNGICAALRTGTDAAYDSYQTQFQTAGLSREDFKAYYLEATTNCYAPNSKCLTFCLSPEVETNPKESEVAMMIRNTIAGIKISKIGVTGALEGPPNTEGLITLGQNDSTDLSSSPIQCPAYQYVNGSQVPNKSSTVKQYYKQVITDTPLDIYTTVSGNDAVCKKTCEETVTVTYGPPVASKAGLCFEYKVKVESKLNCQTEFIADEPDLDDYEVCTPTGSCNGGTHLSASGPTDEFDACINKCDGGSYTQKCINSCYKEVYGSQVPLPVNYNNKPESTNETVYNRKYASQVNNSAYDVILNTSPENIGPGRQYSYDDLKKAVIEGGHGYYTVSGSSIKWKNGGSDLYWDAPGRYYTANITEYTVKRLRAANRCNASWPGFCGLSVVDGGYLRNNYGNSVCMAACGWGGCDKAKNNGYYDGYPSNPGTPTNRQFLNSKDAADVYEQEFARYENAAKECKASASCTTQVSEFTIKVNNKTNDKPDVDNWITYQSSISESGNLNATLVNGESLPNKATIILDRSGCYTPETNEGSATYMTEWSFPGTWVNNKTGKISYEPVADNNAWHLKKEKFCTHLDSKYVNSAWWTQRVLQPTTHVPDAAKALIEEYNIIATAKDFGYFKWDFNIQCFYSLYDNPVPDDPGQPYDSGALSYQTRTIDLEDIFPNAEDESVTTNPNETGRTPGYNWTDGASNVKNSEYEITPGALYPMIQSRGNTIYDADKQDTYLDYEFYLTPTDLNTIRRYSANDANGNYNKFLGTIEVDTGIAYYKSGLFRNVGTANNRLNSSSIITLGTLGVNNQSARNSTEAEVFTNAYTASLKQSRQDYLDYISGGNE